MTLTKDDLYEIEKVLDIYSGIINEVLCKYCSIAIQLDVAKEGKHSGCLDKGIKELQKTQLRIKEIRDKLEVQRK